jgi:large subunit ribosomal protein L1
MKLKASKRFKKLLEVSKDKKIETIEETIKMVKKNCTTKFDESIDVSFNLNLKQKKEEFSLRTLVNLPNGNAKKIKLAVLCEDSKVQEAKDAGADLSGADSLVNDITNGKINVSVPKGMKPESLTEEECVAMLAEKQKKKKGKKRKAKNKQ